MAPRGPVNFFSDTGGEESERVRERLCHTKETLFNKDRERNELERKWRLNKTGFRFHNSHNRSNGPETFIIMTLSVAEIFFTFLFSYSYREK